MKRILIIKDGLEDELLQIAKRALQKNGWQVLEANIADIFSDVEASEVDLIICYSEVPSLPVHFERLKADPKTKIIPIFLLANNINQNISQVGVYIENWATMPFSVDELVRRITITLSKSRS